METPNNEIMNMDAPQLNLYQRVCKPRMKTPPDNYTCKKKSFTKEAFDAF